MALKRNVELFFRKISERFKGRNEKKSKCYWPEIDRYCGCCELTTGIYIRSLMSVITSAVALWVNGTILSYLYEIESIVKSVNLTNIDDYMAVEREDPEADHQTLSLIYRFLVVYHIMWISFKVVYVTTVVLTAFAIYKKNTWILKLLLFISLPNWALDFFISLVGSIMLRTDIKLLLFVCNLSEGYNILALNSEYKKLRGKPRLSADDVESQDRNNWSLYATECTTQQPGYYNRYTPFHCRTCTCNAVNARNIRNNENRPVFTSSQLMVATVNENINETIDITSNTGVLNSHLPEFSSNDTVTAEEVNTIGRPVNEGEAVSPNILEIKRNEDVADLPAIYDQQQLNVGSSPVIEDRGIP